MQQLYGLIRFILFLHILDGVSCNPWLRGRGYMKIKWQFRLIHLVLILQQNKTNLKEESLMARYTGPAWKLSRRLGISLSGTGKELEKRPYAPGQHGPNQRKKLSEYGLQLQEKQKLRHMYGVNERQFRTLFDKAGKMPGKHGENFMILLETRLDNIVYRLGLARTRRGARQLVNHGHVMVDGKRVDIPSFRLKPGQEISLREKSQNLDVVNEVYGS